ncbi:hypothetical protein VTN00DRAFT_609 [Thermoascus crustaceus]|uniref:uncharacterized protein n=1 Tax=Thermoascus crustaceus TaxID=5088 RepID=UPI00374366F9
MSLRTLLSRVLTVLLPLSIASTVYLYLYPVFHGCAFPLPPSSSSELSFPTSSALLNTVLQHVAPGVLAKSDSDGDSDSVFLAPAVFRLLVLADPQLEGDSSLPRPDDEFLPRLRRHWAAIKKSAGRIHDDDGEDDGLDLLSTVRSALRTLVYKDVPDALRAARKRLDLFGNDYYLAHIYRSLHWWSRPTHVAVLGDLIGSQWVTDEEFEWRGWRYWNRVFRGGERVSDDVTITGRKGYNNNKEEEEGVGQPDSGERELETLERYNSPWANKIINIAGNHDIGYAGDVSEARIERFERVFGRADWDVRFRLPPLENNNHNSNSSTTVPTLHIINLNTLTLDIPALSQTVQSDSYAYINDLLAHRSYPIEDRTSFTLLLTHLPLHKREGICTDAPYFSFHESDDENNEEAPRFREGGLKEQNHLSEYVSANAILQGIFGMTGDESVTGNGRGRSGLILNGHDHTGCDVVHFVNRSSAITGLEEGNDNGNESDSGRSQSQSWKWDAKRYRPSFSSSSSSTQNHSLDTPSIREVTLRSMMGDYGGNAGLLSVWFDPDPAVNEWRYEITMCRAGVQHIWWAVHGVGIATFVVLVVGGALGVGECLFGTTERREGSKQQKREVVSNGANGYVKEKEKEENNDQDKRGFQEKVEKA